MEENKLPLSADNFYVSDYPGDGCYHIIARLSQCFAWVGGHPYYGYHKGVPMKWRSEPNDLTRVKDPIQANELAEQIEIKNTRDRIIEHLDEIKRLGNILKKNRNQ